MYRFISRFISQFTGTHKMGGFLWEPNFVIIFQIGGIFLAVHLYPPILWVPVNCEMKREMKYTETKRNQTKFTETERN
jgi:hypothetical protein